MSMEKLESFKKKVEALIKAEGLVNDKTLINKDPLKLFIRVAFPENAEPMKVEPVKVEAVEVEPEKKDDSEAVKSDNIAETNKESDIKILQTDNSNSTTIDHTDSTTTRTSGDLIESTFPESKMEGERKGFILDSSKNAIKKGDKEIKLLFPEPVIMARKGELELAGVGLPEEAPKEDSVSEANSQDTILSKIPEMMTKMLSENRDNDLSMIGLNELHINLDSIIDEKKKKNKGIGICKRISYSHKGTRRGKISKIKRRSIK